jgi:EAL domain-containing protein (putative c-di-GMP-specific phosphodiesterase class I)
LARDLRLFVIAEGVEHEVQARFLQETGCHAFQGFLYGMPMSPHEATRWLAAGAARAPTAVSS